MRNSPEYSELSGRSNTLQTVHDVVRLVGCMFNKPDGALSLTGSAAYGYAGDTDIYPRYWGDVVPDGSDLDILLVHPDESFLQCYTTWIKPLLYTVSQSPYVFLTRVGTYQGFYDCVPSTVLEIYFFDGRTLQINLITFSSHIELMPWLWATKEMRKVWPHVPELRTDKKVRVDMFKAFLQKYEPFDFMF